VVELEAALAGVSVRKFAAENFFDISLSNMDALANTFTVSWNALVSSSLYSVKWAIIEVGRPVIFTEFDTSSTSLSLTGPASANQVR
jgi:hypothetical protein